MKILVIEDELHLADALVHILNNAGYEAEATNDGQEGLLYAQSRVYDLLILDLMLPGLDGISVVRALRKQRNTVPVLMLTARAEVSDRVAGLDAGTDDYLTKPFSVDELLARIRALLRRGDYALADELELFDLRLSLGTCILQCGDRSVKLNNKEFQIMRQLIYARKQYVSKEMLLDKVWDIDSDAGDNCVEAYISFLRRKLVYLKSTTVITTMRMVGYRLEEASSC